MMKAMHILLSVSIKPTAVVEESCASLDVLTFGCLSFVMQQLQQREDSKVSRLPVFVCICVLCLCLC
jgi:hypothetical protein